MSGVGNANTRINLSDVSRVCGSRENLWCDLNELFDLTNSHIINHCIMISYIHIIFSAYWHHSNYEHHQHLHVVFLKGRTQRRIPGVVIGCICIKKSCTVCTARHHSFLKM